MKFKKIYALFLSTVIVTTNCANAFDPGNTGVDSAQHGFDNDHAANPDGPASPKLNAFLSDKLFVPRFGSSLGDHMFDDSIHREAVAVASALRDATLSMIKQPGSTFTDGLKFFNDAIISWDTKFSHLLCNSLSDNVTDTFYVNGKERMYTFGVLLQCSVDVATSFSQTQTHDSSATTRLAWAVLAYVNQRHGGKRLDFSLSLQPFSREYDLVNDICFHLSKHRDTEDQSRFDLFLREYFVAMHAALLPDANGHLKNNTALKACLSSALPQLPPEAYGTPRARRAKYLNMAVEHALALREFYFTDDARARAERLKKSNCSQACASVSSDEFAANALQSVRIFVAGEFWAIDSRFDDTFLKNAIKQLQGQYSLATDDDDWRGASPGTTGGSAAPSGTASPPKPQPGSATPQSPTTEPDTGHIAGAATAAEPTPATPAVPFVPPLGNAGAPSNGLLPPPAPTPHPSLANEPDTNHIDGDEIAAEPNPPTPAGSFIPFFGGDSATSRDSSGSPTPPPPPAAPYGENEGLDRQGRQPTAARFLLTSLDFCPKTRASGPAAETPRGSGSETEKDGSEFTNPESPVTPPEQTAENLQFTSPSPVGSSSPKMGEHPMFESPPPRGETGQMENNDDDEEEEQAAKKDEVISKSSSDRMNDYTREGPTPCLPYNNGTRVILSAMQPPEDPFLCDPFNEPPLLTHVEPEKNARPVTETQKSQPQAIDPQWLKPFGEPAKKPPELPPPEAPQSAPPPQFAFPPPPPSLTSSQSTAATRPAPTSSEVSSTSKKPSGAPKFVPPPLPPASAPRFESPLTAAVVPADSSQPVRIAASVPQIIPAKRPPDSVMTYKQTLECMTKIQAKVDTLISALMRDFLTTAPFFKNYPDKMITFGMLCGDSEASPAPCVTNFYVVMYNFLSLHYRYILACATGGREKNPMTSKEARTSFIESSRFLYAYFADVPLIFSRKASKDEKQFYRFIWDTVFPSSLYGSKLPAILPLQLQKPLRPPVPRPVPQQPMPYQIPQQKQMFTIQTPASYAVPPQQPMPYQIPQQKQMSTMQTPTSYGVPQQQPMPYQIPQQQQMSTMQTPASYPIPPRQ